MSSNPSLQRKTLDRIYDEVIDHLKISGDFDQMRVNLIDLVWSDQDFKPIIDEFERECSQFCKYTELDRNRKDLRANLDRHFDGHSHSSRMVKDRIRTILAKHENEIQEKYIECTESYIKKRFLPQSPPPSAIDNKDNHEVAAQTKGEEYSNDGQDDVDMEIESSLGNGDQSPEAPAYSPISEDGFNETTYNDLSNNKEEKQVDEEPSHLPEPNMTIKSVPSLDEIPIPPEDESPSQVVPKNLEASANDDKGDVTPVKDELPKTPPINGDDINDPHSPLSFSSVSTVHTADLSDFDPAVQLSDDEATFVGEPRNCKIPVQELRSRIDGLQTRNLDVKQETTTIEPSSQTEQDQLKQHQGHVDASESDSFSDGTAAGRRATRKRKSNPRYSNDQYTL